MDPLAGLGKEVLIDVAVREVCQLAAATSAEIAAVLPPVYELLP